MKLLSIVPARGGSKRLPGKNAMDLGDKPLLWHTLDAVAEHSDTIILTSDSLEILELGERWYLENTDANILLHRRDPRFATDTSKVLEIVCHIVEEHNDFDAVGLFLPTAPLRNSEDVAAALIQLRSSDSEGVISTTHYEFPPTLALVKDPDGFLHCADKSLPFITGNTRSQDHPEMLRPNGAIYIKYMEEFQRDQNFFKGRVTSYLMPRERSADIDTELDLKMAELLYERTNKTLG